LQITYGPFERLHFHNVESKIFAAYLQRQTGETGAIVAIVAAQGAVGGAEGLRVLRRVVQACKVHFGHVYGGEGGVVINRS